MAMEERWPELARFKEHYPERVKTFLEALAPAIPDFLDILRYQAGMIRDPMVGMVHAAPDHWAAPSVATGTTNTVSVNMLSGPTDSLVPDPYGQVPPEDKELMERLLTELGPDIRVQTEQLIKTEIRDSMILGGNWRRLKELILKGEKPRVVRKRQGGRDPLFLQFGDGVGTEIEEVRILG